MIQKIKTGTGFRGVLNYVLREGVKKEGDEAARIIDTNMRGEDARELASEFGALRSAKPDLTRAVHHVSLRLPHEERLTSEQWAEVAQDYIREMGFAKSPYVAVDHGGNHIHIVASRIDIDGQVVSDSHDRYRSQDVVYRIEEKFNLRHAYDREKPQDHERGNIPTMSRTEQEIAARTGEVPPKIIIAARINEAIERSDGSRESFTQELKDLGVNARWNESPTTGKIHGASYELPDYEGKMSNIVQGRQIGPDYAWTKLEGRLNEREREYSQETDLLERERVREPQREEKDISRTIDEPDKQWTPVNHAQIDHDEPKPKQKKIERDYDHDWDR